MSERAVFYGRHKFTVGKEMSGSELRRLFGVPATDVLYTGKPPSKHQQNFRPDGFLVEEIGYDDVVAIKTGMKFGSVPREIMGGGEGAMR